MFFVKKILISSIFNFYFTFFFKKNNFRENDAKNAWRTSEFNKSYVRACSNAVFHQKLCSGAFERHILSNAANTWCRGVKQGRAKVGPRSGQGRAKVGPRSGHGPSGVRTLPFTTYCKHMCSNVFERVLSSKHSK